MSEWEKPKIAVEIAKKKLKSRTRTKSRKITPTTKNPAL